MAVECIARRMAGGTGHEHISDLRWRDDSGKIGQSTRDAMVTFVEEHGDNSVYCRGPYGGPVAWVGVRSNGRVKWVQTFADQNWTNNLLSLPEF